MLSSGRRLQEEMTLRTAGLEGLVSITHSLVRAGGLDEETLKKVAAAAAEIAAAEAGGGATAGEVLEREDALSESAMAAAGGGGGGPDVEGGNIHDGGLPHVSSASGGINNLAQSQSLSVVESYDKKQKLQEEMSLGKS